MLVSREGKFRGYAVTRTVNETGPNNLATFVAKYQIIEELCNGEWEDVSGESLEITGFHYLQKRDGSLNTATLDQIKSAYTGWDGKDVFWLEDTDLSGELVQITVGAETYQGQTRHKVQWLDHYDSAGGGGVAPADEGTRRRIANSLGSKLRAYSGGSTANAPRPTAPKPALPGKPAKPGKTAPKPAKPAPPAKEAPATATLEEAWAAFCEKVPDHFSQEQIQQIWFDALEALYPGRGDDLTPEEWAKIRDGGFEAVVPF